MTSIGGFGRVLRIHVQILEQHSLAEGGLVVDARAPVSMATRSDLEVERAVHSGKGKRNVGSEILDFPEPGDFEVSLAKLTYPSPCRRWKRDTRPSLRSVDAMFHLRYFHSVWFTLDGVRGGYTENENFVNNWIEMCGSMRMTELLQSSRTFVYVLSFQTIFPIHRHHVDFHSNCPVISVSQYINCYSTIFV